MDYIAEIALIVIRKHLENAELFSGEIMSAGKSWLNSSSLTLAEEKVEVGIITKRRKINDASDQIGNHIITSEPLLKSAQIFGSDDKRQLNFKQHL